MSMEINWDEAPEGYPLWIDDKYGEFTSDWHQERNGAYYDREGEFWGMDSGRIIVHRRPEPVAWDGNGVPPVGAEFEFSANGWSWEELVMLFNDGISILMAHKKYPANRWLCKAEDDSLCFRPIPTPEQKAAQERERAIIKMCQVYGLSWSEDIGRYAGKLYDAGYRKTGGES